MTLDLGGINWVAVIIATFIYFALGAVWFGPWTPIGKAWVTASGYQSPTSGMSSTNAFYIAPILTSLVSVIATALLAKATGTDTLAEGIVLGLVVGIGYAHAFRRAGQPAFVTDTEERGDDQRTLRGEGPIVFGSVYGGEEDERAAARPDLGHRFFGARAGGQYRIDERLDVFVSGNAERRKYGGQDAIFLVTRRDTFYTAALGMTFMPFRMWKITPQITVIRNKSNILINDFTREIYSVTVRRDFF